MRINKITASLICDCYKSGHKFQYPAGLDKLFLNFTPRSSKYFPGGTDDVAVFGIQAFQETWLLDMWNENFFSQPKEVVMKIHAEFMDGFLGKGTITHDHIAALHDLGYLPLSVRALPEGTVSPVKVPVMTVETTHPDFGWVGGYLEDLFSSNLWKPITVATVAMKYRLLLDKFAEETGVDTGFVDFQGHDFALRGMSGTFDGMQSNIGHLAFFKGTDSFPAAWTVKTFYGDEPVSEIAGSIAATEHSVTCANIAVEAKKELESWWGSCPYSESELLSEAETAFFRRLLTEVYPTGILSVVGDTNDWYDTLTRKVVKLYDEIMSRDGKMVLRPDSGDPAHIVAGYRHVHLEEAKKIIAQGYDGWKAASSLLDDILSDVSALTLETLSPSDCSFLMDKGIEVVSGTCNGEEVECVFLEERAKSYKASTKIISCAELNGAVLTLWDTFGGTFTKAGYKELDPHVGIVYGDSITLERAEDILARLKEKGFASSNVVFGIGSFTYQMLTRDSLGFAIKATVAEVEGHTYKLAKNPVTDDGTKKSATGYIAVVYDEDGNIVMLDNLDREEYTVLNMSGRNLLQETFRDGVSYLSTQMTTIRQHFKQNMK